MAARNLARAALSKNVPVTHGTRKRVASAKLAVSFEGGLAADVQRAARKQTAGNVSAWLAEAARDRLRFEAGRDVLRNYEAEHGAITEDEIAEVQRQWPRG